MLVHCFDWLLHIVGKRQPFKGTNNTDAAPEWGMLRILQMGDLSSESRRIALFIAPGAAFHRSRALEAALFGSCSFAIPS
jgi:hypothetical protein